MTVLKRFLLFDSDNNPGVSWEPYAASDVPGVIKTDGNTLVANTSNQFSVVGQKTKDGRFCYDWIGTPEAYKSAVQAGTIQATWMCYILDGDTYSV